MASAPTDYKVTWMLEMEARAGVGWTPAAPHPQSTVLYITGPQQISGTNGSQDVEVASQTQRNEGTTPWG